MSEGCFSTEELGDIAELDPKDPRLSHLKDCAQCRALLASIREFKEPTEIPHGADPQDAEKRLMAILEGELSRRTSSSEAFDTWRQEPHRDNPLAHLLSWLWRPSLRPALALGAAAIVVVAVINLVDLGRGPDRIVPRQDIPEQGVMLRLNPPEVLEDGRIHLSWTQVEDADSYQVVLFDTDLNELTRLEAGSQTSLIVEAAEIREVAGTEEQILWQVSALRGGDEILRSSPGGLQLP